jgi:2-C-methyl-D-erythritol 4-phosphate cytidylyltransferase/2-C-methyl-D-erythritol 2,4-cyclodiphosphate synthase
VSAPTGGAAEPERPGPVPCDAIVVAAGSSRRMGGRDKLAAEIEGRPLLAWTLEAIAAGPGVERIVIVTAADRVEEVRAVPWLPATVLAVVPGGERRQDSVAAGFAALERLAPGGPERPVLVHDGARPVVSPRLVAAVAEATARGGAAIPVVPVAETLKRVADGLIETTVDRTPFAAAQTPQGVTRGLLRDAYARFPPGGAETWTDEASLLEACRIPVHAIPGETSNLKVTLAEDLVRAEASLLGRARPRAGVGSDSHPFGPGSPLALGGVRIEGAPRLHGHSDGDVALHAVADALLGAASLGDLGRHFPADRSTPRGIASGELLRSVVARVREAGYRPTSVDLTIVAARPRLAGRLDPMRDAIAGLLGLAPDRVNVKASTGNLAGMEGAGRGATHDDAPLLRHARRRGARVRPPRAGAGPDLQLRPDRLRPRARRQLPRLHLR